VTIRKNNRKVKYLKFIGYKKCPSYVGKEGH
jgi:hypothetical protein